MELVTHFDNSFDNVFRASVFVFINRVDIIVDIPIMERKSKRLDYIITNEIVNGIKSKIPNKTNGIILYVV